MLANQFIDILKTSKLVNVVKEEKHIEKAIASDTKVIFFLTGNIGNLKNYIELIKKSNKLIFVHIEMVGGLNCDKEGLQFIARHIRPTGIISTKKNILKAAQKHNLLTVQRIFAIDTDAVNHSICGINEVKPDLVEIMPARIPAIIQDINQRIPSPVIAGGLIRNRGHIEETLKAGAIAVASGTPKIWGEKF